MFDETSIKGVICYGKETYIFMFMFVQMQECKSEVQLGYCYLFEVWRNIFYFKVFQTIISKKLFPTKIFIEMIKLSVGEN